MATAILSNDNLNFLSNGNPLCTLTASSTELKIESTQLNVNSKKITNLGAPNHDNDAATKAYVDSQTQGLDVKPSCVVATTTTDGNIDITSVLGQNDTIDNTSVNDGVRVLLKHQTTGSENGIYVYNSGNSPPWTRADDMQASSNAAGSFTFIENGQLNSNKGFVCTTNSPSDTVDTHSLAFSQFSGAGQITVSNELTKTGDNISITGGGVTKAMMAANSVDSDQYVDGSIDNAHLANGSVDADKLANNIPITTLHDVLVETNSLYIGNDPSNTTDNAQYNVAVGITALDAITTGDNNVAIGHDALTLNTSGKQNVAIGSNAMAANTTGEQNVAIGCNAMTVNTSADYCIAIGYDALKSLNGGNGSDGDGNVAIGAGQCCGMITIGQRNVALGTSALNKNVEGDDNVAIGRRSLKNCTSEKNVALGNEAGDVITTGSNNVIIGHNADPSVNSAANQIVIGHNATGQADNSVVLGNGDVTAVYCAQDSSATLYAEGLNLGGEAVTATAAELNYLAITTLGTSENSKAVTQSSGGVVTIGATGGNQVLNIASHDLVDGGLQLGGTLVTASAAELNILHGVTSTAAELNILHGVTSTAAELNYLDITTPGTSENSKAVTQSSGGVVTIGATDGNQVLNIASHDLVDGGLKLGGTLVTSSAAQLNLLDGVTATTAELNYLAITTLGTSENSKAVTQSSGGVVTIGATEGNQVLNIASHDLVDGGLQLAGTLVTSSAAQLNLLDGVTATTAELNILDGDTAATATTLVGTDRLVVNDAGAMKQVALTDLKTYTEGALVTLSNVTTVGALNAGSITSGFGSIDVGDSTISTTGQVTGSSFTSSSDIRLKTNISEIENGIEKVNKMRGVNFTWKEDNREDFGVIAQEVEEVAPHAVHEGSDGYKKVDYSKLTALLIQAVKEQQTTIESQQSQIDDLKQLVNKLVNSSQ